MALQMNITVEQIGVVVPAYIRVEQVQCNRFEKGIACVARCYNTDPGFPPANPAFKDLHFRVPFDPDGGDPYAQAYLGAKTLPMFDGAVDC